MRLLPRLVLCLVSLPIACAATPSAGSWRRETVLGDNASDVFILRSEWSQPGNYYCDSEQTSLLRIRLVDGALQDTWILRQVSNYRDVSSWKQTITERDSSHVDLAGILRSHAVRAVFARTWFYSFEVDTTGVWMIANGHRGNIVTAEELRQMIPDLSWEPSIVQRESTNDGDPGKGYEYLTIRSGACGSDVNWFEDVVAIPHARMQAVMTALRAQPRSP